MRASFARAAGIKHNEIEARGILINAAYHGIISYGGDSAFWR